MPEKIRKTSLELPDSLWRAAKIRALEEGTDFRSVVIAALTAYLSKKGGRA
jgi:hypothetical protein